MGVEWWWRVRRRWRRLWRELASRVVGEPLAEDALPFALERIAAGDFDDAVTLDANYLRRTDAEIFAKIEEWRVRVSECWRGCGCGWLGWRIWMGWWRWSGLTAEAPHWGEAEYAAIVAMGMGGVRRCLLVAEVEGGLVGFAVGKVIGMGTESVAELESVAVEVAARRIGVGQGACAGR